MGFFQSINGADIRMIQGGEQPRLTRETGPAFGIGIEMGRQELERDLTTQLGVTSTIHFPHATFTERRQDAVRAEVASQQRHAGEICTEVRCCWTLQELW